MKPCSCRRHPCAHTARIISHNSYRNTLRRVNAARNFPGCPNELEALRNENARLRQLLDEIRRRAPKVYDEAAQEREDA